MSRKEKTFFLVTVAVLFMALFAGVTIYASNHFGTSRDKNRSNDDRFTSQKERSDSEYNGSKNRMNREDLKVGTIDSIDGSTITITLGSLEKNTESTEESKTESQTANKDLGTDADSTATPTTPDSESNKDRSDSSNDRPSFDSEDSDSPSFSKGDRDITEDFVPGTEKVTLTVEDASKLEGLNVGDIVRFKYNDDNVLEMIHALGDRPDNFKNRKSSDSSSQNRTTPESTEQNSQSV